jgi:hypothetical protein
MNCKYQKLPLVWIYKRMKKATDRLVENIKLTLI